MPSGFVHAARVHRRDRDPVLKETPIVGRNRTAFQCVCSEGAPADSGDMI
jgi:hypothetical protein